MHKDQLRGCITDVLSSIGLYSEDAVNLLMGTAAVESQVGYYIKQIGGPARGIFQMEPNTEKDIWENYLKFNDSLMETLNKFGYTNPDPARLVYDLQYQIIMCRLHYKRVKAPIPKSLTGQAEYWKRHYNTVLGAGTLVKYVRAWDIYVR